MNKKRNTYIFDCKTCQTRCDGISKGVYIFANDVKFSEKYENLIIKKINENPRYIAKKCNKSGYPDIVISEKITNNLFSYLEIKVQRRTFMSVSKILPDSDLIPSETVALNLSDLLRYFEIQKKTNIPTSIMWIIINRPCIVESKNILLVYQKTQIIEEIYEKYGKKRRFRRKSGTGDIVNGVHKGVVVNYHFSLKELQKWNINI